MPTKKTYDWLSLCPRPRVRPSDVQWDVFISYRSVNRRWVLALYDTLVQAGFEVFVDQFQLVPGASLDESLQHNLTASGAGILVWSESSDSKWVNREHKAMRVLSDRRADSNLPFLTVVAKLDDEPLPLFLDDSLWVDFASYPEGPRGGELLKLIHGIVGKPLSEEAVRTIARLDEETKNAMISIQAAVDLGFPGDIIDLARQGGEIWHSTSMLAAQAAEGLNALEEYDLVLEVIDLYKNQFDRSIRLQHMEALAYRRTDRYRKALKVLGRLYADGHRDPETLGLYGACFAERHEESGDRNHLMKSQQMYADAFTADPADFYTGINAASKAALLGLGEDVFQPIAQQVSSLPAIISPDKNDYWALATVGETKLLSLDVEGALEAYKEAVSRHSELKGNIKTTKEQLEKLLPVLKFSSDNEQRLRSVFNVVEVIA